ncbi:hypothetical protein [Solicola gregarius]|uniref:Uncharacterized protein n=1 Tax=Solicola gregarius TaxID=2908642 RepID=A0AA46YKL3_9ACTN|nr:hypothetical protein [Solicola gregarius]UYM04078.1 hypothetical protein L0C25_16210 [Solicola gregarius]
MPRARSTIAIAALCLVAACSSGGDDEAADDETPTGSGASPSTGTSTDDGPESGGSGTGTDEAPDAAEAETAGLDWSVRKLRADGAAAATRGWTGVADTLGKRVTITGPGKTLRFRAGKGRVQALEMQWPWAVVYAGPSLTARGAKSGKLAVYDLRTGERRMVGQVGSAPPPAAAGSISMYDGALAYPTGPNDHYCLARLDLGSLDGEQLTCAKPLKEGFTQLRLTPDALGYTSFDNRSKPCMTLKAVKNGTAQVVGAAKRCVGWEIVPGGESQLWLQIRNRHRVEIGTAYARGPDGEVAKLGAAMSGSSTWCGGATYYLRPASKDGTADDLMRWSPESGLERVWKPRGRKVSFVFAPHCGGSTITLPGLDRNQNAILMSAPAT